MRVYNYQLAQYHVMVDGQGRALIDSGAKFFSRNTQHSQWIVVNDVYLSGLIENSWGSVPMAVHETESRYDFTFDYNDYNCEVDNGIPANFTVEDYEG